ncbi:MAG: hypothetical protein HW407_1948 [Bacteroidetes bacterium]|nr:hypothetical protein [Bacteroidota bacterium]
MWLAFDAPLFVWILHTQYTKGVSVESVTLVTEEDLQNPRSGAEAVKIGYGDRVPGESDEVLALQTFQDAAHHLSRRSHLAGNLLMGDRDNRHSVQASADEQFHDAQIHLLECHLFHQTDHIGDHPCHVGEYEVPPERELHHPGAECPRGNQEDRTLALDYCKGGESGTPKKARHGEDTAFVLLNAVESDFLAVRSHLKHPDDAGMHNGKVMTGIAFKCQPLTFFEMFEERVRPERGTHLTRRVVEK